MPVLWIGKYFYIWLGESVEVVYCYSERESIPMMERKGRNVICIKGFQIANGNPNYSTLRNKSLNECG